MKLLVLLIILTIGISNVVLSALSQSSSSPSTATKEVYVNFEGGYLTPDCLGTPEVKGYSFNLNKGNGTCIEFNEPNQKLSWDFSIQNTGYPFDWVLINEHQDRTCSNFDHRYSVFYEPKGCRPLPYFHTLNEVTYGILSISEQPVFAPGSIIFNQFTDSSCTTSHMSTSFPSGYTWFEMMKTIKSTYNCDSNNQPTIDTCFRGECTTKSIASTCNSEGQSVYCN